MLVISMPFENQNSLTKVIACLPFYFKNEDLTALPIEPNSFYRIFNVEDVKDFKKLLNHKAVLSFVASHFYFSLNSMFYFCNNENYVLPYSPVDFYVYAYFNTEAPGFVLEKMRDILNKCFSILPREVKILYIELPSHLLNYKQILQNAYSKEIYKYYQNAYKINIEYVDYEKITKEEF